MQGPARAAQEGRGGALTNLGEAAPDDGNAGGRHAAAITLRELLFNETSRFTIGARTTLVLLYFMLAMGDKFLRRLVAALPDFRTKKQVVEIAHQLQSDMSHYLLTVSVINVAFGAIVAAPCSRPACPTRCCGA